MVTPPSRVLELASHDLAGRIAQVEGDYASAIESLRAAVEIEDSLGYMEPPDWPNPVRLTLGDALLQSGEAALAEAVYRRDLSWNRNNSWSMEGLCESLEAQDKLAQDEGLCH